MNSTIQSNWSSYNVLEKIGLVFLILSAIELMIVGSITGISRTGEILIGMFFLIPLLSHLISIQFSNEQLQNAVSVANSHMISILLFIGVAYNLLYTDIIWTIPIAALALAVFLYEYAEHA